MWVPNVLNETYLFTCMTFSFLILPKSVFNFFFFYYPNLHHFLSHLATQLHAQNIILQPVN